MHIKFNIHFIFSIVYYSNCKEVKLRSNGTTLIGRKLFTIFENKPYVAFWKIPYAEPPIGKLRFKPPQPLSSWNSYIYDFSKPYNTTCASAFDEDCLYLNIYKPIIDSKAQDTYSIIVWIHEYANFYGPDFFIDEDVIVVTVSYRTFIFGFLNTGDNFAEGNMGAKDIIIALKWIRDNIHLFDGDINKVTVIGSGRSASIVATLLLTPAAEDLFARVVIQSGSAFSPAEYKNYKFEIANKLYRNLNGPFRKFNRTKLYDILNRTSTKNLLLASQNLFDSTEVRDDQRLINSFGLTVESSKNAFINKHPLEVYKRKMTNNNVEVMIGYTKLEALYKLAGLAKDKKLLKHLSYNFQYILPFEGGKDEYGSKRYREIRRKIMDFYFINGTIGERSLRRYAKYASDHVIYPLLRQASLHAESSCNNVYLYRFSFKGSLNVSWKTSVKHLNWSGATSGDEICYLFRCKSVNDAYKSTKASTERHFIKKIARLLANFAKCGNPTPGKNDKILGSLKWEPLIPNTPLKAMNLRKTMKMIDIPEEKRMKFWDELKSEFFSDSNRA